MMLRQSVIAVYAAFTYTSTFAALSGGTIPEPLNALEWSITDSTGTHTGTTIPADCAGTPTAIPTPGTGVGYICSMPVLGSKTFGETDHSFPPLQSSGGSVHEYLKYSVGLVGASEPVPVTVHGVFSAQIEAGSYTQGGVQGGWTIASRDGSWGLDAILFLTSLSVGAVSNYNITANLTYGSFVFSSNNGLGFSITGGQQGVYGSRSNNFYDGDNWFVRMDGSFLMSQTLDVTLLLYTSVIGNSFASIDPVFEIDPTYQKFHPEVSLMISSGISNAVPEAPTFALMLAGLGVCIALGGRARRLRQFMAAPGTAATA